jgi:hypothetical protein
MLEFRSPAAVHKQAHSGAFACSFALKCGFVEVAEQHYRRLYQDMPAFARGVEISELARIWHKRGQGDAAKKLLFKCLQQMHKEFQASEHLCDREMFAKDYAYHHRTLFELFPNAGAELGCLKLPEALSK